MKTDKVKPWKRVLPSASVGWQEDGMGLYASFCLIASYTLLGRSDGSSTSTP